MDVVDVNAFQVEVAKTAIQLVQQVTRCHAVASGDNVGGLCYAGLDEGCLKITPHIFRWDGIVGNKATFGCYDDFFSTKSPRHELVKGSANGPLASLTAVIDGAINHIATWFNGMDNRIMVELVGFRIVIA